MFKNKLSGNLTTVSQYHNYHVRNRDDVPPAYQRLGQAQRSISFAGPTVWNAIPLHIRNSDSLPIFKTRFKHYLLNDYLR